MNTAIVIKMREIKKIGFSIYQVVKSFNGELTVILGETQDRALAKKAVKAGNERLRNGQRVGTI